MKKAPKLGTPLVDSRLEFLAGPCLECQLHLQQHQGIFGLEGQVYDVPHFFIWLKAFLGKGWFLGHADGTG